ncbi:MAG: extracellular solute-binding protein [Pseudomonadales bacterium]
MFAKLNLERATAAAALLFGALTMSAAEYTHGISFLDELKYGPEFTSFDYVNVAAPKGGTVRIAQGGTYDSFNSFIHKGRPAAGTTGLSSVSPILYDSLLEGSADEPMSHYGLLAEGVEVAEDFSWVAFRLRDEAYWHDGEPLTIEDVIFTFEAIKDYGSASLRTALRNVERIERMGPREVRYVMVEGSLPDPNIAVTLGILPVAPEHYWRSRDFAATTLEPPLGSGPYRILDFEIGRKVTYERVENYWGRDLPVNRGRYNFDRIVYDYFRDQQVTFEARKAGLIDIGPETVAKTWSTQYDFPAVVKGLFKAELIEEARPVGLWWAVFWNLREARFQDIRVREALWLLYDHKFINRVMMYDYYDDGNSLFHGSAMAQRGLPSADELELLEQYRGRIPERVFSQRFEPPAGTGFGRNRSNTEKALALFAEAGWVVQDRRLISVESGEQFEIDFVLVAPSLIRAILPYLDVLERIGIDASARAPEVSNWLYRMRSGSFDAGQFAYAPTWTPGAQLRNRFSSEAASMQFSLNWMHVKDPVVDDLIDKIINARSERQFVAATRAFDRVMLWNFYFIPGMARPGYRLVYWDKFGRPENPPLHRDIWLDAWWWDKEKARNVELGVANLGEHE